MRILAVETSTEACSAALRIGEEVSECFEAGRRHAEVLLPMVDRLLAEAALPVGRLDAVAFGCGPGMFTGLRIGAGIVQGIAFGADLPVVPVSSLAVLAQGVDARKVLAAFDARMEQVYWGRYVRDTGGLVRLQGEEVLVSPGSAPLPAGTGWTGAGNAWQRYAGELGRRCAACLEHRDPGAAPHARDAALLAAGYLQEGRAVSAEQAVPVYLREKVAKTMEEQQ